MRVILKQDGYDLTEIAELERADVLAAEQNMAFFGIV